MTSQAEFHALEINARDHAFDYPWQASMLSLTVSLYKAGLFSWSKWVEVFSQEIKRAPRLSHESINDAYYRQWGTAFETMLTSLGILTGDDIEQVAESWRNAYLNTPHGMPVLLQNADCPPAKAHHHHHEHRGPIAISATAATV